MQNGTRAYFASNVDEKIVNDKTRVAAARNRKIILTIESCFLETEITFLQVLKLY